MTRVPRFRSERGSSLIFALAFISAIAVFSVAILGFARSGYQSTIATRVRTDRLYGADAGIEYGINVLRTDATKCPNAAAGLVTLSASLALNPSPPTTVKVQCQTSAGSSQTGGGGTTLLGGYSTIAVGTGVTNAIEVAGNTNGAPSFLYRGDVYSGANVSVPSAAPTTIQGNLKLKTQTCTPANVTLTGGACTSGVALPATSPNPLLVKVPAAATQPTTTANGTGCTILYPGIYTSAPAFSVGQSYFLASGTYYFKGTTLDLNGTVFGGEPSAGETQQLTGVSPCATDAIAKTKKSTFTAVGKGVTIILGGNSEFRIQDTAAKVELYARAGETGATAGVSLWANTTTTGVITPANYTVSSGTAHIFDKAQKDANVVVHGLTYLPPSAVWTREPLNAGAGGASQFMGGLYANQVHVEIDGNGAVGDVAEMSGTTVAAPSARTVTITATSPATGGAGATVIVATVLPDQASETGRITSWRKTSIT
jgi:hypothetical protein